MIKGFNIWKGLSFLLAVSFVINQAASCNKIAEVSSEYEDQISFLEKENAQLISHRDMAVHESIRMRQHIISQDKAMNLLGKEFESFKKLQSVTKAELLTEIKNVKVPYVVDTVYNKDTMYIDTTNRFMMNNEWASIDGRVFDNYVFIDSLRFVNKFDVAIGYKKKGLFKKAEPIVQLNSYNPYTTVPYVNNIVVKENKTPWYLSRPAMFVYGVGIGYLINN
jgi:hypothetical protein